MSDGRQGCYYSEKSAARTVIKSLLDNPLDAGMRWCERIWTAVATCKKQRRNVFDFIHQSILAHWTGQPSPQLL
jgi:hypothetical protein